MRKAIWMLSALLLVAGVAWAQSTPSSLADVARRVRAERAKKDLSKVPLFTNDSIPRAGAVSVVGETLAAAATGAAGAAEGEGAAGAAGAAGGKEEKPGECDQQCWKAKFKGQRDKIAAAQKELDILQREYNLSRVQYYQDPNQAVREQYSGNTAGGRELQAILQRINDKKAEIAKYQGELSDLEDQLRRAGGDAGWARAE